MSRLKKAKECNQNCWRYDFSKKSISLNNHKPLTMIQFLASPRTGCMMRRARSWEAEFRGESVRRALDTCHVNYSTFIKCWLHGVWMKLHSHSPSFSHLYYQVQCGLSVLLYSIYISSQSNKQGQACCEDKGFILSIFFSSPVSEMSHCASWSCWVQV